MSTKVMPQGRRKNMRSSKIEELKGQTSLRNSVTGVTCLYSQLGSKNWSLNEEVTQIKD